MKRVLVIDDEDGIRNLIRFSLEALTDWEVLTAGSGMEGLAIAQDRMPDAILLDVMMPDLDGIATFQQLQLDPILQTIPTVFLTAKASATERDELIALGAVGAISKPFKAKMLVDRIKLCLGWND
ncbi:response regulator [Altericista sp. CCNU0014]|uniref:response regulator n=1 Tax=Altericista sp. CCNU0014 TaxID=3082949 RepID=UPI00384EA225